MRTIRPLFILLTFFMLSFQSLQAQWVLIDSAGGNPDNSAALEIKATDRGVLLPRMSSTERLAIPTPAEGLLLYQTDGVTGFYYYNGTQWDTLDGTTVNSVVTNVENSNIAVVKDVKGSGVDGGTFTSGAWQTRDLNTLEGDTTFISIDGSTTFTLDSGIYQITAHVPARDVAEHQARLYNVTDATVAAVGSAERTATASPASVIMTVIKIDAQKTFRIENRCQNTNNDDGFGQGVNWGENVYTQVQIEQL